MRNRNDLILQAEAQARRFRSYAHFEFRDDPESAQACRDIADRLDAKASALRKKNEARGVASPPYGTVLH